MTETTTLGPSQLETRRLLLAVGVVLGFVSLLGLLLLATEDDRSITLSAGVEQGMRSTSTDRTSVSASEGGEPSTGAQAQLQLAPNGSVALDAETKVDDRTTAGTASPADGDEAADTSGPPTTQPATTGGGPTTSETSTDDSTDSSTGTSITMPVTVLSPTLGEVADPVDSAETFRSLLAADRLEADEIDVDALAELGATVCLLASASDSPAAFNATRADLANATASDSTLQVSEIGSAVDAVVRAYCPHDAARLGL